MTGGVKVNGLGPSDSLDPGGILVADRIAQVDACPVPAGGQCLKIFGFQEYDTHQDFAVIGDVLLGVREGDFPSE